MFIGLQFMIEKTTQPKIKYHFVYIYFGFENWQNKKDNLCASKKESNAIRNKQVTKKKRVSYHVKLWSVSEESRDTHSTCDAIGLVVFQWYYAYNHKKTIHIFSVLCVCVFFSLYTLCSKTSKWCEKKTSNRNNRNHSQYTNSTNHMLLNKMIYRQFVVVDNHIKVVLSCRDVSVGNALKIDSKSRFYVVSHLCSLEENGVFLYL